MRKGMRSAWVLTCTAWPAVACPSPEVASDSLHSALAQRASCHHCTLSHADPYSESEAPKKWSQPSSGRKQWTITSDGLR